MHGITISSLNGVIYASFCILSFFCQVATITLKKKRNIGSEICAAFLQTEENHRVIVKTTYGCWMQKQGTFDQWA